MPGFLFRGGTVPGGPGTGTKTGYGHPTVGNSVGPYELQGLLEVKDTHPPGFVSKDYLRGTLGVVRVLYFEYPLNPYPDATTPELGGTRGGSGVDSVLEAGPSNLFSRGYSVHVTRS